MRRNSGSAQEAVKPVHLNATDPLVSNLHKGLLFLIMHQPNISQSHRESLREQLAPEVCEQWFGPETARLVGNWQNLLKQRSDLPKRLAEKVGYLPVLSTGQATGEVDEVTAEALNWLLRKLGALT